MGIIDSPQRKVDHAGFNGDATHDLTILYDALFNRAPDASGLAYWQAQMAGGMSLELAATGFVSSVEMTGFVRPASTWDFSV